MTILETPTPAAQTSTSFVRDGSKLTRRFTLGGIAYESSRIVEPTGDDLGDWWLSYLHGRPLETQPRSTRPVRVVDLFCGSGGLGLGFGQACAELGLSMRSELAVDQDAEAGVVYAINHAARRRSAESVSMLTDFQIRGVGADARFAYEPELVDDQYEDLVGNVDVVLAGPPCQGHSSLNNQTRRSDRRNELYLTVPAFAAAVGARCVIIENVPAVIHDRQRVVDTTEQLLRDAGYHTTRGVLSASKMGWAQTRQRFFLIARRDRPPLEIAEVADLLAEPEPRPAWWAISDLEDHSDNQLNLIETTLSEENQRRIDWLFDNNQHDLPPSERPDCHKNGTTYNAVYGRLYANRPAPTITTGFLTPGRGRYIHPTRRRTLSPREAARLQGFPDTYMFRSDPTTPPSKLKLTKWIGDAVPMPLGFAAGISALGAGWD